MASFTNQAQLTYSGRTVNSNIVSGEIVEVITMTKNALTSTYGTRDNVTYVVTLVNSGATPVTDLTLTDDLGSYDFGAGDVVPLTYTTGSVKLISNGVVQAAPTVNSENPLTITGLTVPANGNIVLVYETATNAYTPVESGGTVTNTATATAASLVEDVTDSETITAANAPDLSITKAITPDTVVSNGTITYTFEIENTGNTAAPGDVIVSDTFDPALSNITVTFNGTPWTQGDQYNYNEMSGVFTTVAGKITVPAATFFQNSSTGAYTVTPGTSVLTVTGTV